MDDINTEKKIDFNCDLGEVNDGGISDRKILPFVTSVNIACGYHAGDINSMERTVKAAIEFGCNIGAHPSYPDRENFGRTEMELSYDEIRHIVMDQVSTLESICKNMGTSVTHVKPHGALYNMAARDIKIADAICLGVIDAYDFGVSLSHHYPVIVGLSGSIMRDAASKYDFPFAGEVFSDRGYMPDGSLVPRTMEGALIDNEDLVVKRVIRMIKNEEVEAIDGSVIHISADTLCLHGDGPNAVTFAHKIRAALENSNISVEPLAAATL